MTNLRQAAQHALEALEKNIHYTQTHLQDFDAAYNRHPSTENERGVITDDIEDAFAAMGALRAALAEPEQEPVAWEQFHPDIGKPQTTHWEGCEAVHPECRKPEQEPVAWITDGGQGELWWYQSEKFDDDGNLIGPNPDDIPLYTAPTPRKPLTDEEMRECAQSMNAEPLAEGWPELIKFARAIERKHGIGEQHE